MHSRSEAALGQRLTPAVQALCMAQRTVLLVDGDTDTRKIFRAILLHHGYRVIEAKTAADGLQLAQTARPDVIILEFPVLLPDGHILAEVIKRDPATASIVVLTITSRAFPGELEMARMAGSDACLTKPIRPQLVVEEVERLLGSRLMPPQG